MKDFSIRERTSQVLRRHREAGTNPYFELEKRDRERSERLNLKAGLTKEGKFVEKTYNRDRK